MRFNRIIQWLCSAAITLANSAYSQTVDALNPNPNGTVYAIAIQPDGRILLGGSFGRLSGSIRNFFGRLDPDGVVDASLNWDAAVAPAINIGTVVECFLVQPDGRVVLAGGFSKLRAQTRERIGRMNADGSLDSGFNPGIQNSYFPPDVYAMAGQPDGKILVGGMFTVVAGQPRTNIARLNADGSLDSTFVSPIFRLDEYAEDTAVTSIAVLPDGKILLGGDFDRIGGTVRRSVARLNPNGSLDTSFNADFWLYSYVSALAVQSDGKILAGGYFSVVANQSRTNLVRLNANGTLDSNFTAGADSLVRAVSLQADGRILVGGEFTKLAGQSVNLVGRLNSNGTLDTSFSASVSGKWVYALAIQSDGKILVGGSFTNIAGQSRTNLARLINTTSPVESLTYDFWNVTWLRGGTAPEVSRVTFDAAINGSNWFSLGAGVKIPGGWSPVGFELPLNTNIVNLRARGYVAGSLKNGSGWFVETISGPPLIASQPASRTNNLGTRATFTVSGAGSGLLTYRWRKGGTDLTDGGRIFGVHSATLSVSNAIGIDQGDYTVVLSNSYASVTSGVARLTVADPVITNQPMSLNLNTGQSGVLTVGVIGTAPLTYQWRKDGNSIANSNGNSLNLSNVQMTNTGNYDVVVSSPSGIVTSSVAQVTLKATVDSFSPGFSFGDPSHIVIQQDGKIVLGGYYFIAPGGRVFDGLCRLKPDGTVDGTFDPGADYVVYALAIQSDGKILVAGGFTNLVGQARSYLGRLNPDGSIDSTFNPEPNGPVASLAIQTDGKILVGGEFNRLDGMPCTIVGRLNQNGTLDTNFNAGANPLGTAYALAVQPDGKILLGGVFSSIGGQTRSNLARLNSNGTLDTAFTLGANNSVGCFGLQADGKIVVGGNFSVLAGQNRNRLARLHADGSLDPGFDPQANSWVSSLMVQADGKILIGGNFTQVGGQARNRIGRLNTDGTADATFNPGANGWVTAVALQGDGRIVLGGHFDVVGGQTHISICRINNTRSATESLSYDGAKIYWSRGGVSPEAWRAVFEVSTDGTSWSALGNGTRAPEGWQLASSLASNAVIRARGYLQNEGSAWLIESPLVSAFQFPPAIIVGDTQFGFRTNRFGFNLTGTVGRTLMVDASSNLVDWVAVATNSFGASPLYFNDPNSGNFPRRFYRARLQ